MAHHSSEPSAELRALFEKQFPQEDLKQEFYETFTRKEAEMREIKEQFGATGKFPLGKLTPEDEGEIRIGITNTAPADGALGKVIIDFGKATTWIGFTPEQAHEIAQTLIVRAAACYPNPAGATPR